MMQSYPQISDYPHNQTAEDSVEWLKRVVSGVRNIRGEANIKPSQTVPLLFQGGTNIDREQTSGFSSMLKRLVNVDELTWLEGPEEAPPHALALVGELKIMVPLAGLIDVAAEQSRLHKELDKAQQDLARIKNKLGNEKFVSRAPAEVVAKERGKATELEATIATFREQLAKLEEL